MPVTSISAVSSGPADPLLQPHQVRRLLAHDLFRFLQLLERRASCHEIADVLEAFRDAIQEHRVGKHLSGVSLSLELNDATWSAPFSSIPAIHSLSSSPGGARCVTSAWPMA